jgi:uncharacterized membrane protein YagU involved in acid resistance
MRFDRSSFLRAVFAGGTIGGGLDLLFALTFAATDGTAPPQLLQTIASGLLGEAAYSGGAGTAVLGLASHFVLSYLWAALFVGVASRWEILLARPFFAGAVFGIFVFFAMRLVVLPLSAFPHPVIFRPLAATLDLVSHMLLFGVPIALAARRFMRASD